MVFRMISRYPMVLGSAEIISLWFCTSNILQYSPPLSTISYIIRGDLLKKQTSKIIIFKNKYVEGRKYYSPSLRRDLWCSTEYNLELRETFLKVLFNESWNKFLRQIKVWHTTSKLPELVKRYYQLSFTPKFLCHTEDCSRGAGILVALREIWKYSLSWKS